MVVKVKGEKEQKSVESMIMIAIAVFMAVAFMIVFFTNETNAATPENTGAEKLVPLATK